MREAVYSMHEQWRVEIGPSAAGLAVDHLVQQQQLHAGAYLAQPAANGGTHGSTQPEAHASEVHSTDLRDTCIFHSLTADAFYTPDNIQRKCLQHRKIPGCACQRTPHIQAVRASDRGVAVPAVHGPYRSVGVIAPCATKLRLM